MPEVASPPVRIITACPEAGPPSKPTSSAMPTRQPSPGAGPATRMSPPRLTSTPQPSAGRDAPPPPGRRPAPWRSRPGRALPRPAPAPHAAPGRTPRCASPERGQQAGAAWKYAAWPGRNPGRSPAGPGGPRRWVHVPVGEPGRRQRHRQRLAEQRADPDRASPGVIDPPQLRRPGGTGNRPRPPPAAPRSASHGPFQRGRPRWSAASRTCRRPGRLRCLMVVPGAWHQPPPWAGARGGLHRARRRAGRRRRGREWSAVPGIGAGAPGLAAPAPAAAAGSRLARWWRCRWRRTGLGLGEGDG